MKKILLSFLAVVTLAVTFCVNVCGMVCQGYYPGNNGEEGNYYKPQLPMTGSCGDNITFSYDTDHSFVVTGKGDMYNYEYLACRDREVQRTLFPGAYPPWLSVGFGNSEEDIVIYGYGEIKTIKVEEGIAYIGNNSFKKCMNLSDVSFPDTLEEIGAGAFSVTGLKAVALPDNVSVLGDTSELAYASSCNSGAFEKCRTLANVKISKKSKLNLIGKNTFFECSKLKTFNDDNTLSSVDTICENAFYHCTSLKKISLPKVQNIRSKAFKNCTALKDLKLSNKITEIGSQAFWGCKKIKGVNLGKNIQKIRQGAFRNCKALKEIVISSKNLKIVEKNAFSNVSKNVKFKVPKSKLQQYKKLISPKAPKTAKFVTIK